MKDPFAEDLKSFIATGQIIVEELCDQAYSGDIQASTACFKQALTVIRAMKIAQNFLKDLEDAIGDDKPSASQDESSDDTHDTSHTSE